MRPGVLLWPCGVAGVLSVVAAAVGGDDMSRLCGAVALAALAAFSALTDRRIWLIGGVVLLVAAALTGAWYPHGTVEPGMLPDVGTLVRAADSTWEARRLEGVLLLAAVLAFGAGVRALPRRPFPWAVLVAVSVVALLPVGYAVVDLVRRFGPDSFGATGGPVRLTVAILPGAAAVVAAASTVVAAARRADGRRLVVRDQPSGADASSVTAAAEEPGARRAGPVPLVSGGLLVLGALLVEVAAVLELGRVTAAWFTVAFWLPRADGLETSAVVTMSAAGWSWETEAALLAAAGLAGPVLLVLGAARTRPAGSR